jgi:hypothetical protein
MSGDTLPKPKTRKRGMRENETYWEKTVRKCSAEPLVPIGGLLTAGILMLVYTTANHGTILGHR